MYLSELSEYFKQLESISSRLTLRDILIELIEKLDEKEAQVVSYFLQGRLVPPFINLEFNIAERMISKYITERFNITSSKELGDLRLKYKDLPGVYEFLATQKKASSSLQNMTILDTYNALTEIALTEGAGSITKKLSLLDSLLSKIDPTSGKYILRLIQGRLRLGVSVRSILDALAYKESKQSGIDIKIIKSIFDRAYGLTSDIGYITSVYKAKGFEAIKQVKFRAGIPIAPQLAEREKTLKKCLERIPFPLVDPKMDGLRGQIHIFDKYYFEQHTFEDRVWAKIYTHLLNTRENTLLSSSTRFFVKIFSRNLEDLTPMFPEITEWVNKYGETFFRKIKNDKPLVAVLDSELIGYNENTGEFFGFQVTMTRRRKYGIKEAMQDVPIRAFVFDMMVYGDELIDHPLKERRKIAEEVFADLPSESTVILNTAHKFYESKKAHQKILEEVQAIFYDYVSRGVEGIMIKDPEAPYEPGVRKFSWIKFKRAMKKELADTLDVVVLGYYYGKGRLATLGIGGLLAGVYDQDNDTFVTIAKIGTGFSDNDWLQIKKILDDLAVDRKPARVEVAKELIPDVWVYPKLVIEVSADEITKSPIHTAKVALRFPRFERIREYKTPDEATTLKEVYELANLT